ncbi:MAG: hypothetical protein VB143_04705 [Burkholderia sp.]
MRAIEAECARRGLMMFLADTHDDPGQELRVVQALHQRRVDGVILAPTVGPERRALDYLETARIPSVMVDASPLAASTRSAWRTSSRSRTWSGMATAGSASCRARPISRPRSSDSTATRLALDRAGLPFDAELVRCGHSDKEPACCACAAGAA